MATMEIAMEQAKEQALKQVEEYISSQYEDDAERVAFRFDAFSMWGKGGSGAEEVFGFLKEHDLRTDEWLRGVFSLSKEQALEMGRLVEEWNAEWEYAVASRMCDEDENPMDYYNAFSIVFSPATGREHTISVGRYATESWQWV